MRSLLDWPDSSDARPLGDGRRAVAVDRPDSVDALRDFVARRAAAGLAIYPQGGCTALDYGGIPARPGVALDTTGLDQVIDYPAADMTVTIGAGMTLGKLQSMLATEGQFLPLDAPDSEHATLGGIYATNTCGPRRFGWGRPRDHIIGVSFVTADGKLVKGGGRVVKNVAGYDFPKLLTGSMGTLGVITQITLKVRPKPGASAFVVAPFADRTGISEAAAQLNLSGTRPAAIEILNVAACGGLAIGDGSPFVLAVGFEDNVASVAWQIDRFFTELRRGRADCAVLEGAEAANLWKGLIDLGVSPFFGPITVTASVPRSRAVGFGLSLDPSRWSVQVRAGSGVVIAHATHDIADGEVHAMRTTAAALGGGSILSRCPTDRKERLRVWGEPRGDWAIMERLKTALDPASVLNPGRFVGTI